MNRSFALRIVLGLVVSISASIPAAARLGPPGPDPSVLVVTDVSPDTPFGPADGGMTTSGRVIGVAVSPSDDSTVYAATEWMGVWKSVDGARHWTQASQGLRSGITQSGQGPVIAVDTDDQRLLYITSPKDGRPSGPCSFLSYQCGHFGGLWVSSNAAGGWSHVEPPGCGPAPSLVSVGFSGGSGFVLADDYGCRLTASADPVLSSWSKLPDPPFPAGYDHMVAAPGPSPVLFACQGAAVYRTTAPQSGVWQTVPLPNGSGFQPSCYGIASVPGRDAGGGGRPTPPTIAIVLTLAADGNKTRGDVFIVDFQAMAVTGWLGNYSDLQGSGIVGVWTGPYASPGGVGPGQSYDVFAADGLQLYEWGPGNTWTLVPGLHVDTWGMGFPSSYDPPHGQCTAYATNDGGVYEGCGSASPWNFASGGLRLLWVNEMAGVSRPFDVFTCGFWHPDLSPCPYLYLPSTDDDQWVSDLGGISIFGPSWKQLNDYLGDAGATLMDPAVPTMGMALRNGNYHFQVSPGSTPPDSWSGYTDVTPTDAFIGLQDGVQGGITQVLTARNATFDHDDFFALISTKSLGLPDYGPDLIVRDKDVGDGPPSDWTIWSPVSSLSPQFGPGNIAALAASGGHDDTVLYVMTTDGNVGDYGGSAYAPASVYKGQFSAGAPYFTKYWSSANGFGFPPNFLKSAYSLAVNPYDPDELYVTDLADGSIRVTRDGGQLWVQDPVLKDVATNHGEFDFDCGNFPFGDRSYHDKEIFGNQCPLMQVLFVRSHPEIRVAVLYPGGVAFSRDQGHHWIPLHVTREFATDQPIEPPISAFYDPEPGGDLSNKNTALFIALEGRGLKRVVGPFSTLESGRITYCPICILPSGSRVVDVHASVNSPGPQNVPMHPIGGGLFQGDFVFDAARTARVEYRVVVDGAPSPPLTQALTTSDTASGAVALTTLPPPDLKLDVIATGPDWLQLRFTNVGSVRLVTVELEQLQFAGQGAAATRQDSQLLGPLDPGQSTQAVFMAPGRGVRQVTARLAVVDAAGRDALLNVSSVPVKGGASR